MKWKDAAIGVGIMWTVALAGIGIAVIVQTAPLWVSGTLLAALFTALGAWLGGVAPFWDL